METPAALAWLFECFGAGIEGSDWFGMGRRRPGRGGGKRKRGGAWGRTNERAKATTHVDPVLCCLPCGVLPNRFDSTSLNVLFLSGSDFELSIFVMGLGIFGIGMAATTLYALVDHY